MLHSAVECTGAEELIVFCYSNLCIVNHHSPGENNITYIITIHKKNIISGKFYGRHLKAIMNVSHMGVAGKLVISEGILIVAIHKIKIHQLGFGPIVIAMDKFCVIIASLVLQVIEFQQKILLLNGCG